MKVSKYLGAIVLLNIVSITCFAQELPPIFDVVIDFIQSLFSWPGLIGIAALIEIIFRIFPTEKPKSIAWLIRDIFMKLSKIFELLATFMDKILPQRTK